MTTGPEGVFHAAGLAAGDYAAAVDTPGLEPRGDARVHVTAGAEARLDVVLVPAPVRERVVVSATRGEATLSTLGVATDVLDRERIDERAAPALLHAPRGGAGRRGRAHRRHRPAGLGVHPRRRVALRARARGRRRREPAGRRLRLRHRAAVRARARRGRARRREQPLRLRRARRRREPRDTPRPAGRGAVAARRGRGRRLRVAARSPAPRRARAAPSTGTRACSGSRPTTQEPNSAFDADGGGAVGRRALRLGDGRARRRPARRRHGRDRRGRRRSAVPTSTPPSSAPTSLSPLLVRRDHPDVTHQLQAGYARTHQLSLNPLDSGDVGAGVGTASGSFTLSDFPDAAGLPEPDGRALAAATRLDASLGTRHLLTAGGRGRARDGRDRQPRRGPAAARRARTSASTCRTACSSARAPTSPWAAAWRGTAATARTPCRARRSPCACATARTRRRCARAPASGSRSRASSSRTASRSSRRATPTSTPRRSTTFDLGVEQRLFGSRLRASVTYFHHDYRDQIAYTVVGLQHVRGHVREPRAHAVAGRRDLARGAAARPRCSSSASTRSSTARSSRARATSTPSTPPASRSCAGPATRARSRRGVRFARGASGRRSSGWASAPTATSSASASARASVLLQPATRGSTRGRGCAWPGPVEAFVVAREPARREVPGGARLPGPRAARARRPAARGRGPALIARRALVAGDGGRARRGRRSPSRLVRRRPRQAAPPCRPRRRARVASLNLTADELLVEMLPAGAARRGDALGRRRRHVERGRARAGRGRRGCRGPTSSASSRCAPTSSSSPSTPTPTSCASSRSRACATTG